MTILATGRLDDHDLIDQVADTSSPLGVVHMADFKAACRAVAEQHDGWVHPSLVSALLHTRFGQIDPRSFSAKWAPACGRNGFLDKTNETRPIDPTHSKGNGGKEVRLRRWRVSDADIDWREHAMSDCRYGCKVYRHAVTNETRVFHNAVYGCTAAP